MNVVRSDDELLQRLQSQVEAQQVELEAKTRQLADNEVTLRTLVRVMHAERELAYREVCSQLYRLVAPLVEMVEAHNLAGDPRLATNIATLRRLAPQSIPAVMDSRLNELTPMETRVCKLVQRGMSNKNIAELLAITLETVKTHRRSIRRKLGLSGQKKHLHRQLSELGLPS